MPVYKGPTAALATLLAVLASLIMAGGAPADEATAPTATPCSADCPVPAPATTTGSAAPAPARPAVPADQILSNETTFTTWAWMLSRSPVRATPSASAASVGNLHASTEDGFPEVYLVLRQRTVDGKPWAEVRLPMKQAGRTGWVPRGVLDDYNKINMELVLDRATQRIHLYRGGRQILQIPAGIGTSSTPTPAGHFWIREAFAVRGVSAYGPFAFGTSAYSNVTDWPGGGVVGLHGTDQPALVPGRPSHGCVRVRNADILRLSRLVPVGTPLLVK